MTNFTEPTSYPHECLTKHGAHVTIHAKASFGSYPFLCIIHHDDDGTTMSGICAAHELRDLPKVEKAWANDYCVNPGNWYTTREHADKFVSRNRIGLIRREICDGVITYHTEDI